MRPDGADRREVDVRLRRRDGRPSPSVHLGDRDAVRAARTPSRALARDALARSRCAANGRLVEDPAGQRVERAELRVARGAATATARSSSRAIAWLRDGVSSSAGRRARSGPRCSIVRRCAGRAAALDDGRDGARDEPDRHHDRRERHGRPSARRAGRPDEQADAEREQRQRRSARDIWRSAADAVERDDVEHQADERGGGDPQRDQRQAADRRRARARRGAAASPTPTLIAQSRRRLPCGDGQASRGKRGERRAPEREPSGRPPPSATSADPASDEAGQRRLDRRLRQPGRLERQVLAARAPVPRAPRPSTAIASAPHHATARSGRAGVDARPLSTPG